jgi:hypothetical protein
MPDATPTDDEVIIRTDNGLIHAEVTKLTECTRPEDGARMGGTKAQTTEAPTIHYVDYRHGRPGDDSH